MTKSTAMMSTIRKDNLEYVSPVPENSYDDVIIHLRNNFFADEPMCSSLQVCKRGEVHRDLENHSLNALKDGYSIVVYESTTRKIAAVILNKVVNNGDFEIGIDDFSATSDPKYRKIITFITTASQSSDLFNKYNTDKLFEYRILSVDNEFRNRGIAMELMTMSENIAKTNGFKLIKVDATNSYTRKIAEKSEFMKIYEICYKDYKTEDGEVVFDMPDNQPSFTIYIKYLGE